MFNIEDLFILSKLLSNETIVLDADVMFEKITYELDLFHVDVLVIQASRMGYNYR